MKKLKPEDRDLHTLDIITREVGLLELDDPEPTAEDRRWADSVVADVRSRVAEYRKNRLPKTVPPIKKAEPITKRLAAMPRAVLEPLFASLIQQLGPDVQLAHRHLEEYSDNDLRRLIQKMEKSGRQGPQG